MNEPILGTILDVGGGGEGIVGRVYGAAVTAIDNRQDELDEAPEGTHKLLMDARAMAFTDGVFDNATLFYSLMYMPLDARGAVFREIHRVLAPEGQLFVWDADIDRATPFVTDLRVHCGAEAVKTTYGVYDDTLRHDARSIIDQAEGLFAIAERQERDGHFFLCMKKRDAK